MNIDGIATSNDSMSRLKFPQIERVKFVDFSLYSQEPNLDLSMPDGVFCLAGANGLGKTTFLTTLNYALTGVVLDPTRKFSKSIEEYFRDVRDFSKGYFSGRIAEESRDTAVVELHFSVGARSYRIVRGLFEPSELRELEIHWQEPNDNQDEDDETDNEPITAAGRHEKYGRLIAQDMGLRSFDQFAFLQHFVLTFDESRHLLFWHQQALEQALFLAFGEDYGDAEKAESLRREVERQGSRARNYNWRATGLRNEINILINATDGDKPLTGEEIALGESHKKIQEEVDLRQNDLDLKEGEVSDAELAVMRLSAERTSLETEYARKFARRTQKRSRVELHPLVRNSLAESECSLCGSSGPQVVHHVRENLEDSKCPFCESPIQAESEDREAAARLRDVDQRLEQTRHRLDEAQQRYERLRDERYVVAQQLVASQEQIREFEVANAETIKKLTERPESIQQRITSLNDLLEDHISVKNQAIQQRNQARDQLKQYQKTVQLRYIAAEHYFLPLFRNLAESFLGIDLDVTLQSSDTMSGGLSLVVELRSSMRRKAHQLSESQRFFLDIALRMAFAQYMSDETSTAPMMIDTPEGSLDIAYESRAGGMFASFVEVGHDLIMTANINTSQLLIRLAEKCGKDRMKLQRMTSWAELSEVQIDEEALFNQAYERIEKALSEGVDVPPL